MAFAQQRIWDRRTAWSSMMAGGAPMPMEFDGVPAPMEFGGAASRAPNWEMPAEARGDQGHDDITHKCEGCAGGEPCSSCGGNISRQSPAYQAFEWGMMQT